MAAIEDTATVYIYRLSKFGLDDIDYKLYVDGKSTHNILKSNEYCAFHVKEGDVTIGAIANGIIEHSLAMDLDDDKDYFLKITPTDGDNFKIESVEETKALIEISKTELNGSILAEDPAKNKLVQEKKTTPKLVPVSDEIAKLYEMKEKGIITEAEFKSLKAKIIAK